MDAVTCKEKSLKAGLQQLNVRLDVVLLSYRAQKRVHGVRRGTFHAGNFRSYRVITGEKLELAALDRPVDPSITHPTYHDLFVLNQNGDEYCASATAKPLEHRSVSRADRVGHARDRNNLLVASQFSSDICRREICRIVPVLEAAHPITKNRGKELRRGGRVAPGQYECVVLIVLPHLAAMSLERKGLPTGRHQAIARSLPQEPIQRAGAVGGGARSIGGGGHASPLPRPRSARLELSPLSIHCARAVG
jgi:hypothetical protein